MPMPTVEGVSSSVPSPNSALVVPSLNGSGRIEGMKRILGMLSPVPKEWLEATHSNGKPRTKGDGTSILKCESYAELIEAWRKALKWTDGLDCALSMMLASAMSTNLVGEQLWVKIIGPPSSGKTTLLEGLAIDKQHVFSKDTIRGFYSGYKAEGGEDLSIAALARGKCLATKDGDTLLKAPNLTQILSEARGLYDRVGRTHYRNQVAYEYENHRMTWILCGTAALREIDDSELGARFIDCVVMEGIDDTFEDEVTLSAVNQEANCMNVDSAIEPEKQFPEDLANAMSLTAGYTSYLCSNAASLMGNVQEDEDVRKLCAKLGKFVAYMRARPHKKDENIDAGREFAPRLARQMMRVAKCEAAVLGCKSVDSEAMRRTKRVAFDTSRGMTMQIVRRAFDYAAGIEAKAIAIYANCTLDHAHKHLRFLRRLGVVENSQADIKRWCVTKRIRNLWREVVEEKV